MFQFFFKLYLNRYHSFDNANVMSAITIQDISDILKFLCILFLLDVFERFLDFRYLSMTDFRQGSKNKYFNPAAVILIKSS